MKLYQRTKDQRLEMAKKIDEILAQDPNVSVENIASRLRISTNYVYKVRDEFDCCPLKDIPGREGLWKDIR